MNRLHQNSGDWRQSPSGLPSIEEQEATADTPCQKKQSNERAAPGIEPGTSRTLSENHATRPSSQLKKGVSINHRSVNAPCVRAMESTTYASHAVRPPHPMYSDASHHNLELRERLVFRLMIKASRGFEPRSLDSESRVLTVTPRGRLTGSSGLPYHPEPPQTTPLAPALP